jgi:hypothetical protein
MIDRYVKVVLTAIALELLWLATGGWSQPVSAQPAAIPVIITGIRLAPAPEATTLPVSVQGIVTIAAPAPLKIWTDEPLPVKSVPYTPADRPGD